MDLSSLARFEATLRALPKTLAQRVATKAAPVISKLSEETFRSSEDPYGAPWAPGHDGRKVTLKKTGDLAKHIRYVAIGTKLRVALGVKYAKYQVGKRLVFPRQGLLPKAYSESLAQITQTTARAYLDEGAS